MNNISINSSTWTSIGFGSCLVASNSRTELVHFKLGTTQLVSSYLGSQIHLENDGELFAKSNSRDVTLEVTEIDKDTRDNTAAIEAAMQALQDNSDADALTKSELEARISYLEGALTSPGGGEGGAAGMFLDDGREIKTKLFEFTVGYSQYQYELHGISQKIIGGSCLIDNCTPNHNDEKYDYTFVIGATNIGIQLRVSDSSLRGGKAKVLITYLA